MPSAGLRRAHGLRHLANDGTRRRGALITTVAGLMVAIPSMFGYNWLVHNLRVLTVEMDNFAQELAARMEVEFLEEFGYDGTRRR
jgi:hypothetical protein